MAAQADSNPDYPGTCGRCYEVRCRSEVVVSNGTEPVKLLPVEGQPGLFYDGDVFRPYLPATTTDVKVTSELASSAGRRAPALPLFAGWCHLYAQRLYALCVCLFPGHSGPQLAG